MARDTPFGIATNFSDFHDQSHAGDVPLYLVRKLTREIKHVPRKDINKNVSLIDSWKVLTPKAGSDGGQKIPDQVLGRPWIAPPPSVCTQTFIFIHVANESEAKSAYSYYSTKFFRFLVSLRKITQDALHSTYLWVPVQPWDRQ